MTDRGAGAHSRRAAAGHAGAGQIDVLLHLIGETSFGRAPRGEVMEGGMTAALAVAANGLKDSVGPTAISGRSAPRERACASEPRLAWVLASRRMAVRHLPTTRTEPRQPVDAAIVALVPRAAAGDQAAFTRLVESFHADMARLAFVVCGGNRDLTDDAVQSAWAIAWSRLGTLRNPERIRAWLLSVTANEARQLLRQQRHSGAIRLEFAEEHVAAPDPCASAAALDMASVLARLKPEERTLVGLRYAAGLDSAEIGAVLGMSASGVRSRLDRLLDRLRAELDHD